MDVSSSDLEWPCKVEHEGRKFALVQFDLE